MFTSGLRTPLPATLGCGAADAVVWAPPGTRVDEIK